MNWNIAQAKQHFSDVVKLAATEPQIIYKRNTPVAALITAEDLVEYRAWKDARKRPTLLESFAELRQLLIEAGIDDGIDPGPRTTRRNAFVDMLDEEYPDTQA